ncbi:MAG TPA: D-alanine--D-alanine ligase family protein [Propionibacteriaceae bacterium]|nr:D-alanine--D-alanine ligase family protein [Propionibacteriaceae bacterium]
MTAPPATAPPEAPTRTRVAVVFGGASSEHQVSCLTAAGVVSVLDPNQFDVVGIGITRTGRWVSVDPASIAALSIIDGRLPELSENAADAVLLRASAGSELAVRQRSALREVGPIDVAISLLHGPFGEDGTIQGLFEMMGTRYVGAGVLASAVGMDKHFMKLVLSASGLPVGPFVSVTPAEWARDPAACLEAVAALTYPLFVKPARGGSSLGISRVDHSSELAAAIELAQRHDPKIIVEQGFVGARELECGVLADLDGAPTRASEVAEIRVARDSGFYDFEAKYLPDEKVGLDVPADIDAETAEEVRRLAVRTFEAIGCEGLARVDMFWTADGALVVNEINTMPGFTPHSMFPRMWAASGVPYPKLVEHLIRLAQQRPLGLR